MIHLANAFSLSMLGGRSSRIEAKCIPLARARELASAALSAVGHADTATLLSVLLGREIPVDRRTVALAPGDALLVAQHRGPRLEAGSTTLPEGATIEWWEVRVTEELAP